MERKEKKRQPIWRLENNSWTWRILSTVQRDDSRCSAQDHVYLPYYCCSHTLSFILFYVLMQMIEGELCSANMNSVERVTLSGARVGLGSGGTRGRKDAIGKSPALGQRSCSFVSEDMSVACARKHQTLSLYVRKITAL